MTASQQAWICAAIGIVIVAAGGVAAVQTIAFQQTSELPAFRVGVDAIRIDAVVTDKRGQIVTDLSVADFELRQDGVSQTIALAQYVPEWETVSTQHAPEPGQIGTGPPASASTPAVSPNRLHRTIALVVDDLGLSWESLRDTRRAMHTFVDERVQPGDLVGILRTSSYSGTTQQFTRDKRQLNAIVDQIQYTAMSRRGVEAFPTIEFRSHANDGMGGAGMDKLTGDTMGHGCDARDVDSALATLDTLRYIVDGARDVPGRKVVVLVSEGFCLKTKGSTFPEDFPDPRILLKLDRLYDQAARAGVVIYTLDVRGLQSGGLTAADNVMGLRSAADDPTEGQMSQASRDRHDMREGTQNSLWVIAHETGGQAIENTNDLAAGLARVDEAERGYYVLGYTPTGDTFASTGKTARFHKISVRVKRPGLRVRVRSGFLGHPDAPATKAKTPAEQIAAAATSPFVATTIPVQATVLPAYNREDGNYLRALLRLDLTTLTPVQEQGHNVVTVDVLTLVFDESGAEATHRANTLSLVPDATHSSSQGRGAVAYSIELPLQGGGAYQVRLAVRDRDSGHLGAAGQFVEVQDAARGEFAVSGVLLNEEHSRQVTGAAGDQESAPIIDSTRSVFTRGDRLVYTYEIYNAHGIVEATPSVWRDGARIFAAPADRIQPNAKSDGTLQVGGGIQLTRAIRPGDYLFQIDVSDKEQKGQPRRVVRQTAFHVQ